LPKGVRRTFRVGDCISLSVPSDDLDDTWACQLVDLFEQRHGGPSLDDGSPYASMQMVVRWFYLAHTIAEDDFASAPEDLIAAADASMHVYMYSDHIEHQPNHVDLIAGRVFAFQSPTELADFKASRSKKTSPDNFLSSTDKTVICEWYYSFGNPKTASRPYAPIRRLQRNELECLKRSPLGYEFGYFKRNALTKPSSDAGVVADVSDIAGSEATNAGNAAIAKPSDIALSSEKMNGSAGTRPPGLAKRPPSVTDHLRDAAKQALKSSKGKSKTNQKHNAADTPAAVIPMTKKSHGRDGERRVVTNLQSSPIAVASASLLTRKSNVIGRTQLSSRGGDASKRAPSNPVAPASPRKRLLPGALDNASPDLSKGGARNVSDVDRGSGGSSLKKRKVEKERKETKEVFDSREEISEADRATILQMKSALRSFGADAISKSAPIIWQVFHEELELLIKESKEAGDVKLDDPVFQRLLKHRALQRMQALAQQSSALGDVILATNKAV
jgi:hypothetical protein